jgi:hypothetical protein
VQLLFVAARSVAVSTVHRVRPISLRALLGLLTAWQVGVRPSETLAQDPYDGGFWIGFGFLGTTIDFACCGPLRSDVAGFYFQAGGTLRRRLLVGAELSSWFDTYSPPKFQEAEFGEVDGAGLLVLASYYPLANRPLFFVLGAGVSAVGVQPVARAGEAAPDKIESGGVALRTGIGYEIRLRRNVKLRPEVVYQRMVDEDVEQGGEIVSMRVDPRLFGLQFGLTWR